MSQQLSSESTQVYTQPSTQEFSQPLTSETNGIKRRRIDNLFNSSLLTQTSSCSTVRIRSQVSTQSMTTQTQRSTSTTQSYSSSSGVSTETSQLLESEESDTDQSQLLSLQQITQAFNYSDIKCGYDDCPVSLGLGYQFGANWIQCNDICQNYYHLMCANITHNLLDLINGSNGSIKWICHQCMDRPTEQQKPVLHIV